MTCPVLNCTLYNCPRARHVIPPSDPDVRLRLVRDVPGQQSAQHQQVDRTLHCVPHYSTVLHCRAVAAGLGCPTSPAHSMVRCLREASLPRLLNVSQAVQSRYRTRRPFKDFTEIQW